MQNPVSSDLKEIESDDELLSLHAMLQEAERFRLARRPAEAQAICERLLRQYPDYVGALQTLGLILADKGEFERAQTHLSHAILLNPKDWRTLTALSGVYLQRGATALAAVTLEQAQKLKPSDASILATLGEIYREDREYELSADAHKRAYELDPSLHDSLVGFGLSCIQLGRHQEAAAAFEKHLAIEPGDLSTIFSLTHLPSSTVKLDLLKLLSAHESKQNHKEQFPGEFAFSKIMALDKAKNYPDAWKELIDANRRMWNPNRDEYVDDMETRNAFRDFVRQFPAKIYPDKPTNVPISLFVLGPSRSGKTTLEGLLGTLEGVKRGYENPIIENSVRRTFQTAELITRDRLVELPPGLDPMFQEFYLTDLKERANTAKVFTNTHPGRIFDVLRLASALPSTRFLFIKRDIDDISLRIFMKRYNAGHLYSYSLKSTREYVQWYYDMIDICAGKLPTLCRVFNYEAMIENPGKVLREAAQLCNLPIAEFNITGLGDDRGASRPYIEYMRNAMAA